MSLGDLTMEKLRGKVPTIVVNPLTEEQMNKLKKGLRDNPIKALQGEDLPEVRGVSTTRETDIEYGGKNKLKDRRYVSLIKQMGRILYHFSRA